MAHDSINRQIRAAAGYLPEPEPEPQPVGEGDLASEVRARIAAEAGLPSDFGRWLQGGTVDDLAADAHALAAGLGIGPSGINAAIRRAAGQQLAAPGSEPVPEPESGRESRGFDGGAGRGRVEPGPPSMGSLIRAEIEARRGLIYDRASDLDRQQQRSG